MLIFVPLLDPALMPAAQMGQALQPLFNVLVERISRAPTFLEDVLAKTATGDEFTGHLLQVPCSWVYARARDRASVGEMLVSVPTPGRTNSRKLNVPGVPREPRQVSERTHSHGCVTARGRRREIVAHTHTHAHTHAHKHTHTQAHTHTHTHTGA
jgi:hypothetical protein